MYSFLRSRDAARSQGRLLGVWKQSAWHDSRTLKQPKCLNVRYGSKIAQIILMLRICALPKHGARKNAQYWQCDYQCPTEL